MGVDPTKSVPNLSPALGKELINTPVSKDQIEKPTPESRSTHVELSEAQELLMQSVEQDINFSQIEGIKQAICDGKLHIDSNKIADALINQALELIEEGKT